MIEEEIMTENSVEEITQESMEAPVEEPASEEPVTVETSTTEEQGVTVNVTIEQPVQSETPAEETLVAGEEIIEETAPAVHTFSILSPDVFEAVQSGDVPATMVDAVTAVLGEYQRMTYTVQEVDTDGNVIATSTEYVSGLAGLDYAWITGAILFGLFIAGCFKLLGGLIRS